MHVDASLHACMQAPDFYAFADRLTSPSGQWEGDLMTCTFGEGEGGGGAVVQCKGEHLVKEPFMIPLDTWLIQFDRPTN